MKTLRILGSVFVVIGLFFALLGILASLLPLIENDQLRLILNSFEETSADTLTNTLNVIMRFCLHSSYVLLFSGIALMVTGGLISSAAGRMQRAETLDPIDRFEAVPVLDTPGVPKPAYYPGGMAPPAFGGAVSSETDSFDADRKEPLAFDISNALKAGPISGAIAPAISVDEDEDDAQLLMRQDQKIATRIVKERPLGEDYAKYLSNEKEQAAPTKAGAVRAEAPQRDGGTPPPRPRIVSTMGKRKPS